MSPGRLALVVLALAGLLIPAPAAPQETRAPAGADARALHAEAERLFELEQKSLTRPVIPLPELLARLLSLGDRLEQAGLDSLASRTLGMAGWASFRLGQVEQGKAVLQRAVALGRAAGATREELVATNALATCHMAAGEAEEAMRLWMELIPRNRAAGAPASAARNWGNLIHAFNVLGRVPEALETADSALVALTAAGVPDGRAAVAIARSQLLHLAGRSLEALAWADTAVAEARASGMIGAIGVALGLRSEILEGLDRLDEARRSRAESQAILQASGDRFYLSRNVMARASLFLRMGLPDSCRAELATGLPLARAIGDPQLLSQAHTIEGSLRLAEGRPAEAEASLRTALAHAEEYMRRDPRGGEGSARSPASEARAALAACLLAQGRTEEAFWAVEEGRGREFGRRVSPDGAAPPRDLAALREVLAKSAAALILWSDSRLQPPIVFVVTADSLLGSVGRHERLSDDVQATLQLLASGAPDAQCRPALEALAGKVLPAFVASLSGSVERLYLVPPRHLAGFPVEALPMPGGGGQTLGDRFGVGYVPSARALLALAARPASAGRVLLVADPRPGERSDPVLLASTTYRDLRATPLPAARREAQRISTPDAVLLAGEQATKDSLRRQAGEPLAVVHFATHALANPLRPELSYLLMAGADDQLTAAEVEAMGLAADLVTLSGCRTGGGFTYVGEGTFGLPRSFLVGGARTVVASLWDVEDRAAERFMRHLYDALRAGRARDEALQEARRRMAREGFPLRDRAAFVLAGVAHEPVSRMAAAGPRAGVRPAPTVMVLVFLALVLAIVLLRRRGRFSRSRQ